ncbi:MAG TPA: hypothetical protein VM121_06810 [Acidimicrobiales bacterium]|nr:hypothetical protein [Acidimicrobiales bacterium]
MEKTACTNHECVQVVPGSRVEEREGAAPWTVAYAFTNEQRERIRLHIPPFTCGVSAADEFGAVSTVVAGGGEHVVVAMGTQGVLHRGPDGRWERRAVLGREPLSTIGPSWLARLQLAPLVLVVTAPLLWLLARRRGAKTRGLVVLGLSGAGGLALSSGTGLVGLVGLDYTMLGPAAALAAIGVFVASLAIALRARVDRGA